MLTLNHHKNPCPRTQMSRHDRIARIIRRNIQRCSCELNGNARGNASSGGNGFHRH